MINTTIVINDDDDDNGYDNFLIIKFIGTIMIKKRRKNIDDGKTNRLTVRQQQQNTKLWGKYTRLMKT